MSTLIFLNKKYPRDKKRKSQPETERPKNVLVSVHNNNWSDTEYNSGLA